MADDLRSTLERVGERFDLGEYEVDAYLAVLEHGELTASGIAERTDVPQPRVYDTVRSLADRGLVELRESRPMRVRAVDPEEALGDVRTSLDELVDGLSARYTAPTRAEAGATLVKSRSTILRYLGEVIEAADYELAVSMTPDLLRRFRGALADARAAGASVELLVTPAERAPPPDEFPYAEVATDARARRGITTPVLAVADGEYSVYATQDALREDRERYGVIFDRSALGFLVSAFFGTVLWSTADPLAADHADRPFPRRYASIRRAIKELRGLEGDLYATVVGRDVETGSDRTVRGRIIDADLADTGEVASLTIETVGPSDRVTVGGLVAAFEDVEAREINVGRGSPPDR